MASVPKTPEKGGDIPLLETQSPLFMGPGRFLYFLSLYILHGSNSWRACAFKSPICTRMCSIGREREGNSFVLFFQRSCTCKFLTYIANMLFSLLVCYFEGRLRSAGSSSPPPSFSLSFCVSSLLSHPTLNQALCNSRLFIAARNNWQHFWHIFLLFNVSEGRLLWFFVLKHDRKYMAGSVVSQFFIFVPLPS